jgi:hypothetical protein
MIAPLTFSTAWILKATARFAVRGALALSARALEEAA